MLSRSFGIDSASKPPLLLGSLSFGEGWGEEINRETENCEE
jgi:hypothetical protein